MTDRLIRLALFAAFVLTVVGANWALARYGMVEVTPWLLAPAGVWFAGPAFAIRDALHERGGRTWVLPAIALGAALSYLIEDAAAIPGGHVPIAIASAVAFGLSEVADLLVYERIGSLPVRFLASNTVGAVVDSALFLWLAFGALAGVGDLAVAKVLLSLPFFALVWWTRAVPRHRLDLAGT